MDIIQAIKKVALEYKNSQELEDDVVRIQKFVKENPNGGHLKFPEYKIDILDEVLDHNNIPAIRLKCSNHLVVAETLSKILVFMENNGI